MTKLSVLISLHLISKHEFTTFLEVAGYIVRPLHVGQQGFLSGNRLVAFWASQVLIVWAGCLVLVVLCHVVLKAVVVGEPQLTESAVLGVVLLHVHLVLARLHRQVADWARPDFLLCGGHGFIQGFLFERRRFFYLNRAYSRQAWDTEISFNEILNSLMELKVKRKHFSTLEIKNNTINRKEKGKTLFLLIPFFI